MSALPDAFDIGADAVWKAKAAGQIIHKADLATVFRTAYQSYVVSHPTKEVRPPRKKRASYARNPLFDALASATGSDPSQLTKAAGRAIGVALAEIKEVCPNLNPEEIGRRANRYKIIHKDWPLTANSLSRHWAELGGGDRTNSAKRDVYQTPPDCWRSVAQTIWPGAIVHEVEWNNLNTSIRADILKRIP